MIEFYFWRAKTIVLLLLQLSAVSPSWGQNSKLDSLKHLVSRESATLSTQHIDLMNKLAYDLRVSYPGQVMGYTHKALKLSLARDYAIGEIDANVTLGLLYWLVPEIDKSLQHGLRALHLSDSVRYRKGSMEANLLLGLVYNELADYDRAESFTKKGLDMALEMGHTEGIARACNTLGNHHRRRNEGKAALKYYKIGLDNLEGKKDIAIKNLLLNNIALYYIQQDVEREKTKQYLDKALRLAMTFENKSAEILTYIRMGQFHSNVGAFTKAADYFEKAEASSKALGNHSALFDVYEGMMELETRAGRYDEAKTYQLKYLRLKDSLYSLDKTRQIAAMESRFETEKKEQQIRILEQEAIIQNFWRNVLIAGSFLLLLISYYIFRLQRSRNKKTRELLLIQEFLNDKLKEIDRIKSAFFANISHEFRTPLTLILVPLEEQIRNRSGADRESLLLMKRNATRLLELVNQLLDLSKLEAGKMELQLEKGDLHALLKILSASFDSLAQHRQIDFQKKFELPTAPLWFDRDKIEKIINNLLANAFKFTPADGTVTFMADMTERDGKSMLVLTVADTGKGISPREQELVFTSFYKVSESDIEGTGLGLSLVKELTRFYGGSISLKSEINKGSVFVVELPTDREAFPVVTREEISAGDSAQAGTSRSMHTHAVEEPVFDTNDRRDSVLVVEDNEDLRNYVCSILKQDFVVHPCKDGEEAFALAVTTIPNLVLTDLMMPGIDGMQLTQRLREDERTSHIPVILLTARNDQPSRLQGLKTGADDYLIKPFSKDELLVRVRNLIAQRKLLAERFRERILVPVTPTCDLSLDERFLQRIKLIVEANMSDPFFSVEQLADKADLNRTQLLRKLKGLTGLSPTDFIKDLRLQKAADMIRQNSDTITQIGFAVGFNDQSYFSKCFKKQFGVTPKDFGKTVSR